MRVLVTGCGGQVGSALARALQGRVELVAHDRASLDLARPESIRERVREARPDVIVNAAAYTAVDRAESDTAAARAVNGIAPGILAEEAARADALLVHFSTDYVFDGGKAGPYVEEDGTAPLNAYGMTKLEGERAITATGARHLILRTSWVYGPTGANFLLTMLRLAATRPELRVVDDQHGAPTSSLQLAGLVRELLARPEGASPAHGGIYHATAGGETTWCGFARAIFERWPRASGRPFAAPRVVAIPSSEYPTPARRPRNSRLSCARLEADFGLRLSSWSEGLDEVLSALARTG